MKWNETHIRASSVGYLMTEPQSKADKEAGLLSKTAQKHLLDVYIAEKYGRRKDIQTKQMKKGIEVEQDSIDLLSMYLKMPFSKNDQRFTNDFITGFPDIIDNDRYYMLKKMDVATEENPEYVKEAMKIEFNMSFDDISIEERVLMFKVGRNEDDILRIQQKVERAREFLRELEETHLNFNK